VLGFIDAKPGATTVSRANPRAQPTKTRSPSETDNTDTPSVNFFIPEIKAELRTKSVMQAYL
jgi:hypothetical protein